jgi:GLPGLI family protein
MKIHSFYRFMIIILLTTVTGNALSQDFKGGTVTYQQTTRYDFLSIFGTFNEPYADDWVASLPNENQSVKILHFTMEKALFQQDPGQIEIASPKLQQGLQKADYFRPPETLLLQVYSDFNQNEAVRQIEFMTRYFLISGPMEKRAWKLTNNMVKILDYACMGAEMKWGDDIITAYFTSEIPVSTGPAEYSGLPGLITAVEINGETVFMAISVDLTPPKDDALSEPDTGKKVTQAEFDEIIAEKVKEWEETRSKRGNARR